MIPLLPQNLSHLRVEQPQRAQFRRRVLVRIGPQIKLKKALRRARHNNAPGVIFHHADGFDVALGGIGWVLESGGFSEPFQDGNVGFAERANAHQRFGGCPSRLLNAAVPGPLNPTPGAPVPEPCDGRNEGPGTLTPPTTGKGWAAVP